MSTTNPKLPYRLVLVFSVCISSVDIWVIAQLHYDSIPADAMALKVCCRKQREQRYAIRKKNWYMLQIKMYSNNHNLKQQLKRSGLTIMQRSSPFVLTINEICKHHNKTITTNCLETRLDGYTTTSCGRLGRG